MSDTQLGRDRDRFAPRIIVVTGLGKISVKPGRIGLRLAVRTEGVTAAEAMARRIHRRIPELGVWEAEESHDMSHSPFYPCVKEAQRLGAADRMGTRARYSY